MSLKRIELEFGNDSLDLSVPDQTEVLRLPVCTALNDPAAAIQNRLLNPLGSLPLPEIIRHKQSLNPNPRAVIVVSDNTRPVPYKGPAGILEPVVDSLRRQGISRLEILVANGTHRSLSESELRQLLPRSLFDSRIRVSNHICTDRSSLRRIGKTKRGTEVWINSSYLEADIKILTGLVEPHFMAGFSGGCKSVCPGLIGEASTRCFHGAHLMADAHSDSLILKGNPCHEEALAVAQMAGVDFIINATLDRARRLTGIYAGDLELAHRAAATKVLETHAIPIEHEYDLVITQGGFTGINHYQAAKAGVEAIKAVKQDGRLILAANNTDRDPIGSEHYKQALPLLKRFGTEGFLNMILAEDWPFIPEQWEVQMWGRVIKKIGNFDHLIYCSPQVTESLFAKYNLPGINGWTKPDGMSGAGWTSRMVQSAIDRFCRIVAKAAIAVLADGPYGVPRLKSLKQ